MTRRIALGTDHGGYEQKNQLVAALTNAGWVAIDCGAFSDAPSDYPVFARRVASLVSSGKAEFGILLCRSGNGMLMMANRFVGVRAGLARNEHDADLTRRHNNTNVLVLGADDLAGDPTPIVLKFVSAEFEAGRHARRVGMISDRDRMIASTAGTHQLRLFGVQPWLDDLSDELLTDGTLQFLVDEGHIVGLTSNPTIFQQSISASSPGYATALDRLRGDGAGVEAAYDDIVIHDIQRACDTLRGVYERSGGDEGFVSLEVSPAFARDARSTIAEARRLRALVDRPNLMIKVPGTQEGLEAIRALIAEGIHVNVTLLFTEEHYRAAAQAHLDGLRDRQHAGHPVHDVRGVASVFVSRVDVLANKRMEERLAASNMKAETRALLEEAHNGIGVANGKRIARAYEELFFGEGFDSLARHGAAPQRLLWASTGTKDETLSPTFYMEQLVAPWTVNTMPRPTLEAAMGSICINPDAIQDRNAAVDELLQLPPSESGIDFALMGRQLQEEGLVKFQKSFDDLLAVLREKLTPASA